MKTLVTAVVLALAGLGGAVGADAQEHRPRPSEGGQNRELRVHRYRAEHALRMERIWIAPSYKAVLAGYDHCGKPVYRTVCISEGCWTTRPVCE